MFRKLGVVLVLPSYPQLGLNIQTRLIFRALTKGLDLQINKRTDNVRSILITGSG